jgi:hypothetical protein
MNPIDYENAKIKNLLGIIDEPTYEDLLFEIVDFLGNENRLDETFNIREASLKTKVRIKKDFVEDVDKLEKLGYIEKVRYTQYKVLKNLWE